MKIKVLLKLVGIKDDGELCSAYERDVTYTPSGHGIKNIGEIPPEELVSIRKKEAERAAALAGFESICADFEDLTVKAQTKNK